MVKAFALLVFAIFAVHFYMLAATGHIDPCNAAFAKLEYEHLGDFKNGRRELRMDEGEEALYQQINQRNILQCYKIVFYNTND
ncbi:MAG: hypothetical protein WAN43_13170 [Rhodomicrobium sp.]|jgi:hypothetical protein